MIGSTATLATLPRVSRSTALALTIGLALLALVFRQEIEAAVGVWINSTAYNHCFLVLPIALYLAWDRRASLIGVPIRPAPWVSLAALPLGVAWLLADRLGIMEGRQLVLMGFVELLFLAVLGWRMFGQLAAPLLYLFFLVPFGGFLVPILQTFTARFIDLGLSLTSLPYYIDNYIIQIPEGTFYVAEACAGLRFLIASIAFGVLYAVLIYRSWQRRAAFIGLSLVVPVIANGFRGLGIVWLGHLMGSAQAAAADHVLYGWMFFSVVILLLVLLGLPFRQDMVPAQSTRPVHSSLAPALGVSLRAAGLLVVCTVFGPLAAGTLDRAAAGQPISTSPVQIAGCTAVGLSDSSAASLGSVVRRYSCEAGAIRVSIAVFPPRTNPGLILAEQRRLTGQTNGAEIEISRFMVSDPDAPNADVPWRLALANEAPPSAAVSALWIDGRPSSGGLRMRLRQAMNSIQGSADAPVIVAAAIDFRIARPTADRNWPQERLRMFLMERPGLSATVERLSRTAAEAPSRRERAGS